jgi:hypothetical protein
MDHVTFGFVVPLSDALNCCDWLGASVAEVGTTATETVGTSVIEAAALFVASATLEAVTVTVCCAEINAGAV